MMHSYVKEGEFGSSCSGGRVALISACYQWNLEGFSAHSGLDQVDSDLKENDDFLKIFHLLGMHI